MIGQKINSIRNQISRLLEKNRGFFIALWVMLMLDYLLLFGLESALPGIVSEVLSLNSLLAVILFFGAIYAVFLPVVKGDAPVLKKKYQLPIIFLIGLATAMFLFLVLFGINNIEILFYILISLAIVKILVDYLLE